MIPFVKLRQWELMKDIKRPQIKGNLGSKAYIYVNIIWSHHLFWDTLSTLVINIPSKLCFFLDSVSAWRCITLSFLETCGPACDEKVSCPHGSAAATIFLYCSGPILCVLAAWEPGWAALFALHSDSLPRGVWITWQNRLWRGSLETIS